MTVKDVQDFKSKRKITMLTAYDYPLASLLDRAGIDIVLVGDSLANVVLGLESTTQVGMREMLYHTAAVCRAVKTAMVVGDMPYESYQAHPDEAVSNARKFIDIGCSAVKLEWFDKCLEVARKIIASGIPVMGHIGLTPQTADKLGGFKVQGKDAEAAKRLIEQAKQLEELGCFSIVLECVPDKIAGIITKKVKVPTIGIGAGPECDGQVLVLHDMLGLFDRYKPKFVKQFINLGPLIQKAVEDYKAEVISGKFPSKEHCFSISKEELDKIGS